MKLLVATDAHIFRYVDGTYWTNKIYGYDFWTRYLDVFDEVRIVARERTIDQLSEKYLRVDGKNVEVYGIPFFQGPRELVKKFISINIALTHAYNGCSAALYRMPSQTAQMTLWHKPKRMPFAGEVVFDPWNEFHDNKSEVILRTINTIISNQLSRFCLTANGVSYVTEKSIQRHYPSYARRYHGNTKEHFETFYSTITLHEDAYSSPRDYIDKRRAGQEFKLVLSSVSMESDRKGERIVIDTVGKCRDNGYNVSATLIGDGSKRTEFEKYAESKGLKQFVKFTGLLPSSDDVRDVMSKADMFVFPSQGEGLPRGILEAMAIGLPVLSTPVGGIPEVIDSKYLFDPLDSDAFAKEICYLMDHAGELNKMSNDNYIKSLEYKNSVLQKKRNNFYRRLRDLVDENN